MTGRLRPFSAWTSPCPCAGMESETGPGGRNSLPVATSHTHGAFRIIRPEGKGRFLIFCDHASYRIPAELENLGLAAPEIERHIAWDIGAAGVSAELSDILDAPAILCGTSRLVVDCNRQLTAHDLIPEVSDGTAVSIHTMTACLGGNARPWQIALSSYTDRSLVEPMLEALRRPGDETVGDNQPYALDPAVDYSTPYHAMRRNMPCLQVEFRQDEVADAAGQVRWARRFAVSLAAIDSDIVRLNKR